MRKIILSLVIFIISFLNANTVWAIICYAQSQVAWGVGYSYNFYYARNRAMYECQIRTPYGMYCIITGCNYYHTDGSDIGAGGVFGDPNFCPDPNFPEDPDFDPNCPPTFEEN